MSLDWIIIIGIIAFVMWNTTNNVKKLKSTADSPLGQAFGFGLKRLFK